MNYLLYVEAKAKLWRKLGRSESGDGWWLWRRSKEGSVAFWRECSRPPKLVFLSWSENILLKALKVVVERRIISGLVQTKRKVIVS